MYWIIDQLLASIAFIGKFVLTITSSSIASLLLSEWRKTHSKFAIPLENSICNIYQGSELAQILKVTKLIIWGEAPMTHKFCFEALDKILRDIMSYSNDASSRSFWRKSRYI